MNNLRSKRTRNRNISPRLFKPVRLKESTIKERFLYKLVSSLDYFVVRVALILIVLYVVTYGYFVSKGFALGYPNWGYVSILVPILLIDVIKGLVEAYMPAHYKSSKEEIWKVSVIVPTKNGGEALRETLSNLSRRFVPENIIVVSNGSTDNTISIAESFGVRCLYTDLPVGKVKAIIYALDYVNTPYVLLIDDDTLIGSAHIPTGLLEEGYEAVAFRVLVNTSTWITQLQMYEYRKSTDIGKRYHNKKATVQNISGAVGLFNVNELLRQILYHTREFAGEDLQRTLLVHLAAKRKGVVLTNSIVYTNPPTSIKGLFNQRTLGWFPGLYVNFTNYLRLIFRPNIPYVLKYDAFYNAFLVMVLDIFRLISLPVLIFYPWFFAVMYVTYVILESLTYLKSGSREPYWVVLAYPVYGLFGFITRICAFVVFLYRRLVSRLAHTIDFDDYKQASVVTKFLAIIVVILLAESILLGYIAYLSFKLAVIY